MDDGERMLKPEVLRLPWMFIVEHTSLLWSEADLDEILSFSGAHEALEKGSIYTKLGHCFTMQLFPISLFWCL